MNDIKTALPGDTEAQQGEWVFLSFNASNGITLPYQLRLPLGYGKKPEKKYPLFVFMHGLGSVGTEGKHIFAPAAEALRVLAASPYSEECIVMAPQHPRGVKWVEVNYRDGRCVKPDTISPWLFAAKELFDTALSKLPLDPCRVYGWGNSMGAFSLWDLSVRYPDFYAAIVPVSGGGDPEYAKEILELPVRAFHGDSDPTVNFRGSADMIAAMNRNGAKDAAITVFPGAGHDITHCFGVAPHAPGLFDWIFSQKRKA